MAEPKSKQSTERPSSGATNRIHSAIAAFFAARLNAPTHLCVGLSGGRDSVVLLHALSCCASDFQPLCTLSAVHVHHAISPNADAWADFCADFCQSCSIPLKIVRVEVPRNTGDGLEAAARQRRHAVFADCDADWLVLAHHRDDQAETVLLNLLRGAGLAGAAGMLAERPPAHGPGILRPLLELPRALIEDYATENGLRWIDDESNADVHYRRNFVRREVLPQLEVKFAGARQSLARAASHFAEGAALLEDLAALDRAALGTSTGRIDLRKFNDLSPARARNLLRFEWIRAGFRAPDTRWMEEALRQLAVANADSETCLSTADGELHVYRGELHLIGPRPKMPSEPLIWSGEPALPWAGGQVRFDSTIGAGIRKELLPEGASFLRARQGGERLQPDAKRPRRRLRNLLQEAAVPPWERSSLPVLWCGERLLWVGGVGVDAACACLPGEAGISPVWDGA